MLISSLGWEGEAIWCPLSLLTSDWLLSEFTLYDKGVNPDKLEKADTAHVQVRQEMGTILYKQNVLGSRGPRKMKVMVPSVNEQGERKVLRPTSKDQTMLERSASALPRYPCSPFLALPSVSL